jgi:hypothetical protein
MEAFFVLPLIAFGARGLSSRNNRRNLENGGLTKATIPKAQRINGQLSFVTGTQCRPEKVIFQDYLGWPSWTPQSAVASDGILSHNSAARFADFCQFLRLT